MSDIIDKTPPNAETLKGRIHLIAIPTHRISHNAHNSSLGSSNEPIDIYSFEHTGRVCGYISDENRMYLLGNENIDVNRLDSPTTSMWCGFNASSGFTAVPSPPTGWSGGYAQESNVWRIGMKRGSDYNLIDPLQGDSVIIGHLSYGYESFPRYLYKYKKSGSDFVLTTDINTTISFKRMDDHTKSFSKVFNTDLTTYTNGINAIHDLASVAYSRLGDDTEWEVRMPGGGGADGTYNYMNMVASNLIITHDLDAAKKYVADGTIPCDYVCGVPT